MGKIYPDSKVEVSGFEAKHYDFLLNLITFGVYNNFIRNAIQSMEIDRDYKILDLGSGSGKNACIMQEYLSADGGEIVGLDIGDDMIMEFQRKCSSFPNVKIFKHRIDKALPFNEDYFDIVFISFVLHGLPQDSRIEVLKNAYKHLKKKGRFFILDYNEMKLNDMPFFIRFPFKVIECKYAFDYMENYSWKDVLGEYGFGNFSEKFYFRNIIRLLGAEKIN